MFLALLAAAALAGDDPAEAAASDSWGLVLAGGYGGGVGPPSLQGHLVGRATIRLGTVGLAFGGREGVATAGLRTIGGIFVGGQGWIGEQYYVRAGFAHHHETPWEAFKADPFGSFAGVSGNIDHRSGFEAGGGWMTNLSALGFGEWAGLALDGSVVVLPDPGGPPVYGCLELLFTVRVH